MTAVQSDSPQMNIGIYIYDEAEVLDFSGPFEVFSTASRISGQSDLFTVFLIGETGHTVNARGGYLVNPTYSINDHPQIDTLVMVGGVYENEISKEHVLRWIKEQSEDARYVASVCTGVFLLAESGVISGQKVTTHWEDIPRLREEHPNLEVVEGQRWTDDGKIITSGGISAGIDMSLHLVSKFSHMALAERTAKQMEFSWSTNTCE